MIDTSNVSASVGRPFLGKAVRSIRIISAEKRVSSNKNDMLTLELEICAPDTEKASDGSTIKVAGLSFRDQITFHGKNNIPLEQLKALVVACKASPKVDLDDASFLKNSFVGKGIRAEVRTEPKPLTQVDDSGNVAPVLDDSGSPVVDNNYRLGRVIGSDDRYTISADAVQ